MAKKNFKGGLDSLIENSLGIKKSRKSEMKGNPVDLIKPEQTDDNDEVLAKPRTPQKPADEAADDTPKNDTSPSSDSYDENLSFEDTPDDFDDDDTVDETPIAAPKQAVTMSLDASDDDNTKIAYLKEVITDLRHELFLWRNGTINVQSFNATLHTHGLKYNPENNEIEEFDTI